MARDSRTHRPLTAAETAAVYLTIAEVLALIGVSYTTLWRWQAQGRFPHRRRLGPNRVGFLRSEVEEWSRSRPRVRRDRFDELD